MLLQLPPPGVSVGTKGAGSNRCERLAKAVRVLAIGDHGWCSDSSLFLGDDHVASC